MSKKNSNKTLAIVFILLLIIVVVVYITGTGKNERTFRKNLVSIDTTSVTKILIFPKSQKGKEVKLFKNGKQWKVQIDSTTSVRVPKDKIKNIFNTLLSLKAKRLAARGKSKYDYYAVTNKATRVEVFEGNKKTLDLIIGKFSYADRQLNSFVRLTNDNKIYEVNGFLGMTFNQKADAFRDGTVINSDYLKWNRLSFTYPDNSSFQLIKIDNKWFANKKPADSVKVSRYLSKLSRLYSSYYVDDINKDSLTVPNYRLTIDTQKNKLIVINGFKKGSKYIIHSSMNKESYFNGSETKLWEKIFIGMKSLMPGKSEKKKRK